MKIWKSLILTLLVIFISGCGADAVDIYNRPIKLSNYRGKWVLINYWATWCSPCVAEIPTLNTLAQSYKNQVVVFGVNTDGLNDDVLRNLSQGYGAKYLFLKSFPIENWGGKTKQLPVTYVFDKKGNLYKTLEGPQTLKNFQEILSLPDITDN